MGLNRLDLAIIALYLAGITLFGLRFRKRHRTLRDYFLAGRDIPWSVSYTHLTLPTICSV